MTTLQITDEDYTLEHDITDLNIHQLFEVFRKVSDVMGYMPSSYQSGLIAASEEMEDYLSVIRSSTDD